ncbi:MAG: 1-deoxy-D-xylulose-5-phosphate reductoisomerase, partial [Candidatus Omnitrophica bacterium]|nr:1-deoxy-D-xylulose-5-phosphate reductoisomerase [Candidatus Omnitrophota bacterium]
MKNVVLLGSTGSVGKNVLNIVRAYPDKFRISGIAAGEDINLLGAQVEEFKPDVAVIGNKNLYSDFKTIVSGETKILSGIEGVGQLASGKETDIVFMAISGIQALDPLIAAITAGKTVALASKEPIVSAGALIKKLEKEHNARILPVDSEHSAIMQCLCGRNIEDVNKLYITGSGGSLFGVEEDKFDELSVETVLNHPKWDMGRKITVDSATLMNKGLELIEARWLFNVLPEKIKIIIHPEAIIHSMVEFIDGTISA